MKIKHLLIIIFLFVLGTLFIIGNFKNNNIYNNKEEVKNNSSIAIMVENGLDSGVYEKITTNKWPKEGYKYNAELSNCENNSSISWDNTNKTIKLSGRLTDKCYIYFDVANIITFSLEEIEYQAEDGMTWKDWLNSRYNTFGYNFNMVRYDTGSCLHTMEDYTKKISSDSAYYICDGDRIIGEDMSRYFSAKILSEKKYNELDLEDIINRNQIKLMYNFSEENISKIEPSLLDYGNYNSYGPFIIETIDGGIKNADGNYEVSIYLEIDGRLFNDVIILSYNTEQQQFEIIQPTSIDHDSNIISFNFEYDPLIFDVLYILK